MNKLILILLFSVSLVACVHMPKTGVQNNTDKSFTRINEYDFHTLTVGKENAPVIIVVHGGPGGDFQYLTSLKALAKDHRVVFYDQRGTGLSPRVDESELTVEQNLKDLSAMVKYFGKNNKVILIGHSWGGMLVSGYLSKHPEKVSHAIIVEPGMLNSESAHAFVSKMEASQSIWNSLSLIKYLSVYPFVAKEDGHEGFDYVMTKILNNSSDGAPYQCENEFKPEGLFIRGGYAAFNQMLRPVMQDPDKFNYNLTDGALSYKGKVMLISSECSVFGYNFQEKYHRPKFPSQTIHVEAKSMGHNMLTLNPEWSISTINSFLKE